jgi:hypothetical protein
MDIVQRGRAGVAVVTRAVNQAAPNFGASVAGVSETAARAFNWLPASDSGCGW